MSDHTESPDQAAPDGSPDQAARPEAASAEAAPDQERLDALQKDIDQARAQAQEVGGLEEDEAAFVDTGTVGRDLEDQTIAPPG